jgi:RNA polymerase sigma-70 factor (sigma-E family)
VEAVRGEGVRVRPEDEREYGDYVAARARRLCEFAYLLCGDWHAAQDAVQTALTRLYLAWPRLQRREAVDPYVRQIVIRSVVDQRRLARFRREASWAQPPDTRFTADLAEATPDRLAVLAALAQVPPRQRAVLVLRYWEDQSVDEVALALGCSTGTVKSQAARGLQTLRELLGDEVTA